MLPVNLKPYKDESFISWFCRTSFENGSDPKDLALSIWNQDSLLYRDLDRFIPDELVYELAKKTSLNFEDIKELTLEPLIIKVDTSKNTNPYKKWYFILPFGQKGKIRTNGTHFCPECLNSKTSFINKYWRISWYLICSRHKKLLFLNCPKCNQVFSPEKQDYINPHIYLCSKCKYDLRKINSNPIDDELIEFQNELTDIFSSTKSIFNFPLLVTTSKKDLFLTLNILLAFLHKILRQPIRFKTLIKSFNIDIKHQFTSINNGIFSRLNYQDRYILLSLCTKLFQYPTKKFIDTLNKNHISQNIFQQTFNTISPTVKYIVTHLSDKKLHRNMSRREKNIFPNKQDEVKKLFDKVKPLIINHDIIK